MSRTSLRGLVGLLLACTALVGCETKRKELPAEETRIKNLAILYGRATSRNKGRSPADAEALKKFAKSLSADELKAIGIDGDVDQLFISPRDGEPFVYRPAKGAAMATMGGGPPVFYEKTGKNGKRFVAYATGQVEEVDAAKFKQLVPEAP